MAVGKKVVVSVCEVLLIVGGAHGGLLLAPTALSLLSFGVSLVNNGIAAITLLVLGYFSMLLAAGWGLVVCIRHRRESIGPWPLLAGLTSVVFLCFLMIIGIMIWGLLSAATGMN